MNPPLPLEEAQARLLAIAAPLPVEEAPAAEALGRYLAAPLVAQRTQPDADLSAMDGYAVTGDSPWRVVGESRAGHPFGGTVASGEAVRISTGAAVPEGAAAILVQEDARSEGESLVATERPIPGRHIRRRGFDFAQGDALLGKGSRIGPAALALTLAAGHATLPIHRKPRLAILDSGDELATDPAQCPPGKLPASNGAMLAAMAAAVPCEVLRIGPVPDDRAALAGALARAEDCDLLVTSGGASVGDHDLIRPALEEWGARLDFWRVALKPGKPLIVAQRGAQVVLGLPGNPVSSYVTAFLFMLPLLRRLSGAAAPLPRAVYLTLATSFPPVGTRREFLRARLGENGLEPIAERDSSALLALSRADALVDRPANAPETPAGTPVPAYLLENGAIA